MVPLIEWQSLPAGNHRLPCPSCGRSPKDRTLGVTVEHGGAGVAHCFRCAHVETHRPRRQSFIRHSPPQRVAIKPAHEGLSAYGQRVWNETLAIARIARAYLGARHCLIPPADSDLRWHPALRHPPSGHVGPALVGLVTHAETGKPMSLHQTWIKPNGEKANVKPERMLLGGHSKAGGVIRLWPDEAVTLGLGVAEGVETALSLAHAFKPAWSCIDAGNLARLPVLSGVESLLIAADNDETDAGITAAKACALRWVDAGREVRIAMPGARKTDFNDLARAA